MPVLPDQDAPTTPTPHHRPRTTIARIALAALALTTLVTVVEVEGPTTVAAGRSCTGWTSRLVPPKTIRVLRTGSGRVVKVSFRKYVAEVMASGEWPGRLHRTTLEAGAVATKQYAWYYALKGHHRSGFTRNGHCYDVRDDTMDQLYRPERARPTKRQVQAVAATWRLTLRKNGRFFLTGYRAGTSRRCAADANGWKLYARSVQACARKGWSRQRVQRAYLSPNLSFVWSASRGPGMRRPRVVLRAGNRLPNDAATVVFGPKGGSKRVRSIELQRRIGRGSWRRVGLDSAAARKADVRVRPGHAVRFRVRGVDAKGKRGPWAYSRTRKVVIRGRVGRVIDAGTAASGRRERAKLRFRGRSVALVAPTGPGMGRARILLGGRRVATIDLSRANGNGRELVWARNFDGARRRTVSVVAADGQVHFEGFLILR
jgi:hypothetical protein